MRASSPLSIVEDGRFPFDVNVSLFKSIFVKKVCVTDMKTQKLKKEKKFLKKIRKCVKEFFLSYEAEKASGNST